MEVRTVRATTLDELALKINDILSGDWFAPDLFSKDVYVYKPIYKEEKVVVDLEKESKRLEKAIVATTAAEAVLVNAQKESERAFKEETRQKGELAEAQAELAAATDPAAIAAAQLKVDFAETVLANAKMTGTVATKALDEASAAVRKFERSSGPSRSVRSIDGSPSRSMERAVESSASRPF